MKKLLRQGDFTPYPFKNLAVALFASLLLFASCVTDPIEPPHKIPVTEEPSLSDLGATNMEQNSYARDKTQAVYDSIAQVMGLPDITLEPTDYYVRFLTVDSLDYDTLTGLGLELFDFPMHLDLTLEQERAFAEDTSDGGYWYYTTVEPGFEFPEEIKYEKLDEVYIQRLETEGAQLPDEVWEAVLDALMGIPPADENNPATRANNDPDVRATIKYQTDHPAFTGEDAIFNLEGVKVRVWQGVNWAKVTTNSRGETGNIVRNSGRLFKKPVNYQVIWESNSWNIRSGDVGQARSDGPRKTTGSWPKTFGGDNIDAKYATAHKALWNYVYRNNNSELTKDLTISNWKLNTAVVDGNEKDGTKGRFLWGNLNPIKVWTKDKGESAYRKNWEVEETTYHELGHASHWRALRIDDGKGHNVTLTGNNDTGEPYAEFVSNCFMRSIYEGHIYEYLSYPDGYNGLGEWLWYQGFTPKQIETIMCEEREKDEDKWGATEGAPLNTWRDRAKSFNVTAPEIIDILFDDRWDNWRIDFDDIIIAPETTLVGDEITIRRNPDLNIPFYAYNHTDNTPHAYFYPNPSIDIDINYVSWGGVDDLQVVRRNSQQLVLRFPAPGTYNISYNTLVGSKMVPYTCTKSIEVVSTYVPVISSPSLFKIVYPWPFHMSDVTFEVDNPMPDVTYEWLCGSSPVELYENMLPSNEQGTSVTVNTKKLYDLPASSWIFAQCRARRPSGEVSEWSNEIKVPLILFTSN